MTARLRIEALGAAHDRKAFACGVEALDRYFHDQVGQDVRRRVTACYVACDAEGRDRVAGFYTLAAAGVVLSEIPQALAKRLPRYGAAPVALLGRLAIDQAYRGQGLGGILLWDAVMRAARSEVAVFAVLVDAKDAAAEAFYRHHGFVSLDSEGRRLVLPLTGLRQT